MELETRRTGRKLIQGAVRQASPHPTPYLAIQKKKKENSKKKSLWLLKRRKEVEEEVERKAKKK